MQTMLSALLQRFNFAWPAPEGSDLYFSCDPDGEVRQQGNGLDGGTELDFYPSVEICKGDRSEEYGGSDVVVTEKDFKEAVDKLKQTQ